MTFSTKSAERLILQKLQQVRPTRLYGQKSTEAHDQLHQLDGIEEFSQPHVILVNGSGVYSIVHLIYDEKIVPEVRYKSMIVVRGITVAPDTLKHERRSCHTFKVPIRKVQIRRTTYLSPQLYLNRSGIYP